MRTSLLVLFSLACAVRADEAPKPVRVKDGDRILFLGDSLTYLGGKEEPKKLVTKGYVRIVKEKLQERYKDIEVDWASTGGGTVQTLLSLLDKSVLPKNPTIVVIQIGCNDARGSTKEKFESGLEELIDRLHKAGIQVVQCSCTSVGEKHDGTNPADEKLEIFAQVARDVAKRKKVPLNDLRKAFVQYWKKNNADNKSSGILTYDGNHFNQAGMDFVAEQMLNALQAPPKQRSRALGAPNPESAAGAGLTAADLTKLIERLVDLDSIDLAPRVKFRAGLEPPLHEFDADESAMTAHKDPYAVQGEDRPGAAGWYRLSFVVPEKIGKFPVPKSGYNLGIESNVLGAWEIYTYKNGKPHGLWSKDGMNKSADRHATDWMSNAPQPAQPGDKFTVAILAMASPLGRGSPEGFALRHLRLRFAWGHTGGRQPFYGSVYAPGQGTGLLGAREMLSVKQGADLQTLQAKLRGPIARLHALFAAADTGQLDNLTKAMTVASKELNEALKK